MADPFTIAAAVAAVAGPIIGGFEERAQLKDAAKADRENARRTEFQGELDAWETAREARLAQGAGMALAAADGNPVGTGTIADLVEQAAIERELEIGALRYRARGEADNLRASAKGKERGAKFALIKGALGAVAAGAGAVSSYRSSERLSDAGARDRASRKQGPLARGSGTTATSSSSRYGDGTNMTGGLSRVRWGSTRLPGG